LLRPRGGIVNWHPLEIESNNIPERHPDIVLGNCSGDRLNSDKYSEKLRKLFCIVAAKYFITFIIYFFLFSAISFDNMLKPRF